MRPPEFTGGNGMPKERYGTMVISASMRPPEFTGGNHAGGASISLAIHSLQ